MCAFCALRTWSTRRFVFPAPRPSHARVPSLSSFIIKITNLFHEKAEIRSKKLFIHLTLLNPRRFFATLRYWWETEDDETGSRCDPARPWWIVSAVMTMSVSSPFLDHPWPMKYYQYEVGRGWGDRSRIKNWMMKFWRKWCAFKYLIRIWADS